MHRLVYAFVVYRRQVFLHRGLFCLCPFSFEIIYATKQTALAFCYLDGDDKIEPYLPPPPPPLTPQKKILHLFACWVSLHSFLTSADFLITFKAPPIICSRRQFQILLLFPKKNKAWFFRRIVCHQTFLTKYHTSFKKIKNKKDVAKIVVGCSRDWRFKG